MIPGVGRYSMLITPRAGSLFHAVFQQQDAAGSPGQGIAAGGGGKLG